jgi:hypothetical protein
MKADAITKQAVSKFFTELTRAVVPMFYVGKINRLDVVIFCYETL